MLSLLRIPATQKITVPLNLDTFDPMIIW